MGLVLPQVQDPALALAELHQVPLCPTLSELAEGTLCAFIQVIEQDWDQYRHLGNITSYRPPTRLCAADHNCERSYRERI